LLTIPALGPDGPAFADLITSDQCPPGITWLRGQLERGESGSEYEHWQAVVAFSKKKSLAQVKSCFGRTCHAELSRSEAANEYVCKESTRLEGPFELGGSL